MEPESQQPESQHPKPEDQKIGDMKPEELRDLIEKNNDYANQLKKDIEDSSPFISDLTDISHLITEYHHHKFEDSFEELYKKYT